MSATLVVRKFKVTLRVQRYANSPEILRTLRGGLQYDSATPPADILFALHKAISAHCADLHRVGEIRITLHAAA